MAKSEETLFAEALALPPAEQVAFLDSVCAGNEALRRRLAALLEAHRPDDSYFDSVAAASAQALTALLSPGQRIGPYRLVRQLGEGGMGVVYLAEQEAPVRRRVALKVVKPGLDSRQVIARFEAERQALAVMDHAHIAKVYDAGITDTGRPYFVMEHIDGVAITRYCDDQRLSPRERLELFIPVCEAVQHAHQKGIIHRDLKPSNMLVALVDGRPVPKVIDFGVAKAIHHRLTDLTIDTSFGQVVGTLEYMSPEQAERRAVDIDTRSDLYSLGVVLYELLTGTTPFDQKTLREAGILEMLRVIREEEPAKPSTRLSQSGDTLPSVSARRNMEPARLSKFVRGDLDWIVMKCLEKDRVRRYATANGLAADLRRFLLDEAVEACPPTRAYRFKKFLRRNKGPVVAGTLALTLLIAGVAGTTWGWREAIGQRREAVKQKGEEEQQAQIANVVNQFLQRDLLQQADADEQAAETGPRNPHVTVRTVLDRAAKNIEGRFKDQPLTEAAIRTVIAQTYVGLGLESQALAQVECVLDLQRGLRDASSPDLLSNKLLAAQCLARLYRIPEAEAIVQGVLDHAIDADVRRRADRYLARMPAERGDFEQSAARFEDLVRQSTAAVGLDHKETRWLQNQLADVYRRGGQYERAESLFRAVADWQRQHLDRDHSFTQATQAGLALVLAQKQEYAEAEALLEKAIESASRSHPGHIRIYGFKERLALVYRMKSQFDAAEPLLRDALVAYDKYYGPMNTQTIRCKFNLANVLMRLGRADEGMPLLQECFEAHRQTLGYRHPTTRATADWYINALVESNRYSDVATICREIVEFCRKHPEPMPKGKTDNLMKLGRLLIESDRMVEAEEILRAELAIWEKQAPDDWNACHAQARLGIALAGQSRFDEAKPLLVKGYESLKQKPKGVPADVLQQCLAECPLCLLNIAKAENRPGEVARWNQELDKAEAMLKDDLAETEKRHGKTDRKSLEKKFSLAMLFEARERYDDALPLFQETLSEMRRQKGLAIPGSQASMCHTIGCLVRLNRHGEALPFCRELTEFWGPTRKPIVPIFEGYLLDVGESLIAKDPKAAAEVIAAGLALCKGQAASEWKLSYARTLLGHAYLKSEQFEQAKEHLTAGYEGLKQNESSFPKAWKPDCFVKTVEHLIAVAEATKDAAAAARWREELAARGR